MKMDKNKPKNIIIATYLLLFSLFLEMIVATFDKQYVDVSIPRTVALFILIFAFIFTAWIIFKIAQGRNWARYVLLIFGAIGLIPSFRRVIDSSTLISFIEIGSLILGIWGTYLIFIGSGRHWFDKKTEAS